MRRISLDLPPELIVLIDQTAAHKGINRAGLIRMVMREYTESFFRHFVPGIKEARRVSVEDVAEAHNPAALFLQWVEQNQQWVEQNQPEQVEA